MPAIKSEFRYETLSIKTDYEYLDDTQFSDDNGSNGDKDLHDQSHATDSNPPPKVHHVMPAVKSDVHYETLSITSDCEYLDLEETQFSDENASNDDKSVNDQPHQIDSSPLSNRSTKTLNDETKKTPSAYITQPITKERLFTRLLYSGLEVSGAKWMSCDICNYQTHARTNILKHMQRWHTGQPVQKKFTCVVCGIQMSHKGNLNSHMRIHTGEKPFPCTFESCDRRFTSSTDRTFHMRRHLGVKPYSCDQCPSAFVSKYDLNFHFKNRHTDHRPHTCEECGHSFKLLKTYKNHLLTHTNIRKYHCEVCGKMFRQDNAFKVHMNIHTDNRPYKCSFCERGFHSAAARRSHEKSVHNVK